MSERVDITGWLGLFQHPKHYDTTIYSPRFLASSLLSNIRDSELCATKVKRRSCACSTRGIRF